MRGIGNTKDLGKTTIILLIIVISLKALIECITNIQPADVSLPINLPMPPDVAIIFICFSLILFYNKNLNTKSLPIISRVILTCIVFYSFYQFVIPVLSNDFWHESSPASIYQKTFNYPTLKMSPISGLLFFISGLTLLLSEYLLKKPKTPRVIFFSGLTISFIGFTAILGYLYQNPVLYGSKIIPISLNTSVCFLFLGYRLIIITGNLFFSKDSMVGQAASRLIKAILPIIIIAIIFQGFIIEKFDLNIHHALYTALLCLTIIIIISIYVLNISRIVFKDAIHAEIDLKKEHEFNSLLLQNLVEGVLASDSTGRITMANKVFTNWAGMDLKNTTIEQVYNNSVLYHEDGVTRLTLDELPLNRAFKGETFTNVVITKYKNGKHIQYYQINGAPFYDNHHVKQGAIITLHDITDHKTRELERTSTIKLLQLLNERNNMHDLIKAVVSFLQHWSQCEAVGIRLKEEKDYPYFETLGFTQEFVKKENQLCARDCSNQIIYDSNGNPLLECMCGNILNGKTDSSKPYFTIHGSFYTNSTTKLLKVYKPEPGSKNRNNCHCEGYESMALIPLRSGSETLGLIQLNDRRENCFSPELISLLEQFSDNIALALHQRKTEEALVESEEKYRSLAESNDDYIMRYDKHGRHLYMNTAALNISGLTAGQVIGKTHSEAGFDPQISMFWEEKIKHVFQSKEPVSVQFKWVSPSGPEYLDWRLNPEFDVTGEVQSVLGVSRNITLQKKREEELRILSRAVDQNPASIIITDIEGNIEYVNRKFTEITGYTPEEVKGKNPRFLKSDRTPPEEYTRLWQALTAKEEWQGEFINKKKNGEIYYEWAFLAPIQDEDNKTTQFVAVKEDITEKKKLIADLILAKERAVESDKLKSAFLANMSHEIRTPMNAIMGFSELLVKTDVTNEILKKYAEIIHSRSHYLLALIEDILDLSKVEAGILKLKPSMFSLNNLIDEISIQVNLKLQKQNKQIEFAVLKEREDKSSVINCDKNRIQQLIVNLVDNAIKFTHKGSICLKYTTDIEKGIVFSVTDTGIGIPEKNQKLIFDRFHKLNNLELNYSGLGLGLSICQGLVRLLDGDIWLQSEPGKGSVFSFNIPVNFIEAKKPVVKNHVPLPLVKCHPKGLIMLVEDDEYNIELFKNILDGNDIIVAENGETALDTFKKNKINLVLLDIGLPDISGLEVSKQIQCRLLLLLRMPVRTIRYIVLMRDVTTFFQNPLKLWL